MLTLVTDIFVPFTTISILNAILIRAIRKRNQDLEAFDTDRKHNAGKIVPNYKPFEAICKSFSF